MFKEIHKTPSIQMQPSLCGLADEPFGERASLISINMKMIKDLGMKFPTGKSNKKERFAIYECNCGNLFTTQVHGVKNGHCKSCGCLNRHGFSKTKLYIVFGGMKQRCYNKNHVSYKDYGLKGVTICDKWLNNYTSFHNWAINSGYREGLQINRKNTTLGYYPKNCKWSDRPEQMQNTTLLHKNNTSGYRGVGLKKDNNKWYSKIMVNKKNIHLGYFPTPESAAQAYNDFVIANKTFHPLNIIPTPCPKLNRS